MKKYLLTQLKPRSAKLFSLLLFLVLSSTSGFSQQAIFSTTFLSLVDTSYIGNTDANVKVVVKNISSSPYSGYINFYYTTDTAAFTPVQFCSISSITLNPSQSDTAKCSIKFDTAYFKPADNIIIIWSSGAGKVAADSLWDKTYMNPSTAGIHDLDLSSILSVYPTLTNDFINVEMRAGIADHALFPETIKVTDVFGRSVNEMEINYIGKNKIQVNTSKLNPGIYLLEIYLPSNRRMTAKFIRQ